MTWAKTAPGGKGGESSLAREGRKTCDKAEAVEHRQPIERSGGRHEAEMRQDRPCATDAGKPGKREVAGVPGHAAIQLVHASQTDGNKDRGADIQKQRARQANGSRHQSIGPRNANQNQR